ncbi:MAG: carboxypeptidase-like regulatory domain-containing protein [Bryobacteraceae bacterium]
MQARWLYAVALTIAFAAAAGAQTEGTYSLSGSVLNSQTGEPVANALVTALRAPSPGELERLQRPGATLPDAAQALNFKTAFTGPGGEFQFTGLTGGQYNLQAQKPGFMVPSDPATTRPSFVELCVSMTGVQVKLAPLGVIEGKIVDQYGDAIRNVNVRLIVANVIDGDRSESIRQTKNTDDTGLFHFGNVAPGKYYVKLTGKAGGTYMYVGDNSSPLHDTWESFTPTYFGGSDIGSAPAINIAAGTQARADFTLSLQPAFKVRGELKNFVAHETVTFELLQGNDDATPSRAALDGTTGKFEIEDLLPGSYTLRATQGQKARGEVAVTVKGEDVSGVALALSPPVTVTGTVRTIGASPNGKRRSAAVADEDVNDDDVLTPACSVSLKTPGHRTNVGQMGRGDANGAFRIGTVFSGEYRVVLQCEGGYPVSVQSGDTDLLTNPRLTIQPGVAPALIEVALKPGGGMIEGKLKVNPLPAQAGVLLVPTFSATTGPVLTVAMHSEDATDESVFEHSSLAPGDYLAYAFSTFGDLEFRDPFFLESLTGGVSVHVEDGKSSEVTLTRLVK